MGLFIKPLFFIFVVLTCLHFSGTIMKTLLVQNSEMVKILKFKFELHGFRINTFAYYARTHTRMQVIAMALQTCIVYSSLFTAHTA